MCYYYILYDFPVNVEIPCASLVVWSWQDENRRHYNCESTFRLLYKKYLCVNNNMQGFDEFMNLVMDDAEEVYVKEKKRRQVGEFTQSSMYSDSWHCNSFIAHVRMQVESYYEETT